MTAPRWAILFVLAAACHRAAEPVANHSDARYARRMTIRDEVHELLELAATWPVTAATIHAHLAPRARSLLNAGSNLDHPPWADSVSGEDDLFIELGGDVTGIETYDDDRGWGAYAELYVAHGTVGDLEPLLGKLEEVPIAPDDFRGRTTVAAYPTIAGHRLRVFVEHVDGQIKKVTIHFERS